MGIFQYHLSGVVRYSNAPIRSQRYTVLRHSIAAIPISEHSDSSTDLQLVKCLTLVQQLTSGERVEVQIIFHRTQKPVYNTTSTSVRRLHVTAPH